MFPNTQHNKSVYFVTEKGCDLTVRLKNGVQSGYGHVRYDLSVNFTCHHGFFLRGTSVIQCMPFGVWSSPAPTCQRKY